MAWCGGEECHDRRAMRIKESTANSCCLIEKRGPVEWVRCMGLGSRRLDGWTSYKEHFRTYIDAIDMNYSVSLLGLYSYLILFTYVKLPASTCKIFNAR
jgi:hypothetical protein